MRTNEEKKVSGYLYLLIIINIVFIWIFINSIRNKEPSEQTKPTITLSVSQLLKQFSMPLQPTEPLGTIETYSFTIPETKVSLGCPDGCIFHKEGCDIKGNVSFDSGEKIYHVPGQNYYSETKINTSYGERWFCTEDEAISNGWRKSYE